MGEAMSPLRFKHGILRLCDPDDPRLVSDRVVALRLWSAYIDADEATQIDCSRMLRDDLAALERAQEGKG